MNVSFRFAYQIVSFIDTKKEIFRVEGEEEGREKRERERGAAAKEGRGSYYYFFFLSLLIS